MRKLVTAIGALFVLLILTFGALYLYLTPERLRQIVQPRVSSALSREVTMREIGLSLWGGVAASVDGLVVSERQGFGSRPFVQADRASIYVSLWSIVSGSPEIGEIELRRPELSIVVNPDGGANYDDILEKDEDKPQGPGVVLPVSLLTIANAQLIYEDRRDTTSWVLDGLDYTVEGRLDEGRIRLEGDLSIPRLTHTSPARDPLDLGPIRGDHVLLLSNGLTQIDRLTIGSGQFSLDITGSVDSRTPGTQLDLHLVTRHVALAGISGLMPGDFDASGSASADIRIRGPYDPLGDPPSAHGTLAVRDGSISHLALPGPVTGIHLDLALDPTSVSISRLEAHLGSSDVAVDGDLDYSLLASSGILKGTVNLHSGLLDIDGLLAPTDSESAAWTITGPLYAAPPQSAGTDLDLLGRLSLQTQVTIDSLRYAATGLSGVALRASVTEDALDISSLHVSRALRGIVKGSAQLGKRGKGSQRRARVHIDAQNVELAELVAFMPDQVSARGRLTAVLDVETVVDSAFAPVFRTSGRSLSSPSVRSTILLAGFELSTPDLLQPVHDGSADLVLDRDRISIRSAGFRAGQSSVSTSGTVDGLLAHTLDPEAGVRPLFALAVESDTLDLDALVPLPQAAPSGQATGSWLATSAWAAAPGPAPDMTSPIIPIGRLSDGAAAVDLGHVVSEGVTYRRVKANLLLKDGRLSVPDLRTGVYGGQVTGKVLLDVRPTTGRYPLQADLTVDSVNAQGLLKEALGLPIPLEGRMGMKVDFSGVVDSTLELVQKGITAEGDVSLSEGTLVNWGWLKKAVSGVNQLGFLNVDAIPVKSLLAPFSIRNDRVFLREMKMSAAEMACRVSGSAGLDGSLDYVADVDMPAQKLNVGGVNLGSTLGNLFATNSGVIPLRIVFKGSVNRPDISLSLQEKGKEEIKAKQQETEKKLKEGASKLWNSLLKK